MSKLGCMYNLEPLALFVCIPRYALLTKKYTVNASYVHDRRRPTCQSYVSYYYNNNIHFSNILFGQTNSRQLSQLK